MLKVVIRVLLAALVVFLIFAATRPDSFHLERSTLVQAPPERVYAELEDFHRWAAWSPWETKDPAMKREFSGPAHGVGATYAWSGNSDVGAGRMEIAEAQAPSRLLIRLDFLRPFEAHHTTTFTLAPQDGGTRVTWAMDGASPYLSKVMQLIVSMDRMVGPDFEQGLAKLKFVAESPAK